MIYSKLLPFIVAFGLLLLIMSSCRPSTIKRNNASKITVAFSGFGCEGDCPFQAVSVDSSLALKYYGGPDATPQGYFTGTISRETWDSAQTLFEKFIKRGIDTTINQKTDHPDIEFFVHDNFKKHRIRFHENMGKVDKKDMDILKWLFSVAKRASLTPSDSLFFETNLQYPIYRQ